MNAISRTFAWRRSLSALLIGLVLQPASAHDQRYVALDIPSEDEELSQASPAINDWGEIVYVEFCNCPHRQDVHRIVSTKRGTLVDLGPNGRSPEINNWGEVVYVEDFAEPGTPPGFFIYSTKRGRLARGNTPVIDEFGYVAGTGVGEQRFDMGIIRPNLTVVEIKPIEGGRGGLIEENFKDRHAFYIANNEVGLQLYSTHFGQISNLGAGALIAVNAVGKYVYSQYGVIYSQRGDVLYTAPDPVTGLGGLDMNVWGDIVFVELIDPPGAPRFRLVLLTKRPAFYERYYGFKRK